MRFCAVRVMLFCALICGQAVWGQQAPTAPKPNFVIILADDLGYGDLGCYGQKRIKTPNLDRMAGEGMRMTDFYVAAPVCTPSRAALLTGCYPMRAGLGVAMRPVPGKGEIRHHVLYPKSHYGLNPDEVTVAELLKAQGYATACVGKWHVGDQPAFLPTRQGFDCYFGVPYSNDMKPPVLMRDEKVIEEKTDLDKVTERYTEEAIRFIAANRERPFFLYLAHNAPHTPLNVPERFRGRSAGGLYGDDIESIDWSVGEVLSALKKQGLDERTMVVFLSDNGPWIIRGEKGGFPTPFRNGKGTTYEGGMRVPCIVRWPTKVPKGSVSSELACSFDLLPTFVGLAGGQLPTDRKIDGKDILSLLTAQPGAKTPHEAFFYYYMDELQAVRSGSWKLKLETTVKLDNCYQPVGDPTAKVPEALYNLETDPGEQKSVLQNHPDVVQRLHGFVEQMREDLGDAHLGIKGKNVRPIGFVGDTTTSAAATPAP